MQSDLIGKSKQFLESVRVGLNVFGSKTTEVLQTSDQVFKAYDNAAPKETQETSESVKLKIDELTLLNPSGRLDYVIQEGMLENPYLSALAVQ